MNKIDRKAFWQDFWEEYRSMAPLWYKILMSILGLVYIVFGIVLKTISNPWSQQNMILSLVFGILFLILYPFLVFLETKKEYAKPKKKK